MKNILIDQYLEYLKSLKINAHPTLTIDKNSVHLRSENTSDLHFDIIDKKESIIVPLGKGSATYSNLGNKSIEIVDYEDLINQLPEDCNKDIKRADFILYHKDGATFFIVNELSQSSNVRNKRKKAISQLHNTVFHLMQCPETSEFINKFEAKICIFSNKERLIKTLDNPALAFEKIKEYLPDPISIKFSPITKLGFKAIETATYEL